LFSSGVLSFFWPAEDKVWIEIAIDNDVQIESIMVKDENVKGTLNDMEHLKKFVSKSPHSIIDGTGLSVLGETNEAVNTLYSKKIADVIAKYSHCIHMIHVTD